MSFYLNTKSGSIKKAAFVLLALGCFALIACPGAAQDMQSIEELQKALGLAKGPERLSLQRSLLDRYDFPGDDRMRLIDMMLAE